MVTTNSAVPVNPALDFTVKALRERDIPEELEAANAATACISEVMHALKPILKYIDDRLPCDTRGIIVCRGEGINLILFRNGEFSRMIGDGRIEVDPHAWEDFTLSSILNNLKEAFELAVEKKEDHVRALKNRLTIFQKIGDVIRDAGQQ